MVARGRARVEATAHTRTHGGLALALTTPAAPPAVIYHLNSKGEDHDLALADVADAYEGEIDAIMPDAAGRIARFKTALERERVSGRAADAVKELSERFEKAKRELQADAEAAKARCEERETALAKHHESRLTLAADDIEAAKEEFAKRLKDFEGKLKHGSGASKAEL